MIPFGQRSWVTGVDEPGEIARRSVDHTRQRPSAARRRRSRQTHRRASARPLPQARSTARKSARGSTAPRPTPAPRRIQRIAAPSASRPHWIPASRSADRIFRPNRKRPSSAIRPRLMPWRGSSARCRTSSAAGDMRLSENFKLIAMLAISTTLYDATE